MKKIIKVLIGIMMLGLVVAGVSFSRTITLTAERKAIADDWGLTEMESWQEPERSLPAKFCIHKAPHIPESCSPLLNTLVEGQAWQDWKLNDYIDKEIAYRNKPILEKEPVAIR